MKKCIYFIIKIPFYLLRFVYIIIKWILTRFFGFLFGWIPDFDERMSGEEFEEYVKEILIRNSYKNVELTKRTGDYGVDILAEYKGIKYAIQCKKYAKPVGVAAVQQAYTGCEYYGCDEAVVVTNNRFTNQAIQLSQSNGVILWDKDILNKLKNKANSQSLFKRRYKEEVEVVLPYDKVIEVLLENGYASTALLVEQLGYTNQKAYYVLEDLEFHDLVSKEDPMGIRDLYFLTVKEAREHFQ
ncbi:MAG: restriction endonuclease [Coprobacillus sp.]